MKNIEFKDILKIALTMVEESEYTGDINKAFEQKLEGYDWNEFTSKELLNLKFHKEGNRFFIPPLFLKLTKEGTMIKSDYAGEVSEHMFSKLENYDTTERYVDFDEMDRAITNFFIEK